MPIKRYDQTDPHDLGMSGVCGGDLHPVADGDWVLYDHHEQVVEKEVARLETMLAEVRTDLRIMRASHDRLAAERAEHADEVARLRECLRIAGLHAFMRVRPPDEVAAHLHMVLRSHSDAADKAEAQLADARRVLNALSQWAADAVYAMGRVAPDAPRFEALEDRLDEIRAAMRETMRAPAGEE